MLASPAALRPASLKPALRALFCATHSDWERFDEIFDAYWRGRRHAAAAGLDRRAAGRKPQPRRAGSRRHTSPQDALGLPDRVERRERRGR